MDFHLTCLILTLRLAACAWLGLRCLLGSLLRSLTKTVSAMWAAEAESECARHADEALIKSFEQPIGIFLRDRSIGQSLLDSVAQFRLMCLLDCRLHRGEIDTLIRSDLLECLATLQRRR